MKSNDKPSNNCNNKDADGFLPNSLKFISSCIKTASSGVRSAGASVGASISGELHDQKDQVLWACFDRLELAPSSFKNVLLLGYTNGFQVIDVEDASNVSELVSRRDDPVTFLQMQPRPSQSDGDEGFRDSHPLLLVVACDDSKITGLSQGGRDVVRDSYSDIHTDKLVLSPTAVRFYSLRSHTYVHVLRFRSTVYMVRCSPQIVAVGLATQIYCFDALSLESKFSVITYPVPQLSGQGTFGVNIGYGPMAVGPRWLAYASNNALQSNSGRLSPQSLTPPGVSPSTSPSSGSLVARYAMESSKQIAAGLINLGDVGYKTLSKYYQELVPDGSNSPVSSNSSWKVGRHASHSTETDIAGMVVVKDFASRAVVSQFRAHTSPISALCFDPSGTLLVTASIHGNNINIFRIMPSCSQNGSGIRTYDWSSSHVHLYKLHRGMTSAMIQHICFSHFSQWISIVSSKGTCHIFALAPFGGETVLRIDNSHVDGPILLPVLSFPWWSTPSFMTHHQSFPAPPPPITLSVVSRIKNSNSCWLNTVSSATSSAAGKASVPSGALSAVFHCSIHHDLPPPHLRMNALEHLLVYAPSGHVIQYKLLPSVGGEQTETASGTGPSTGMQMQDEELRVKVEPIRWWDVCRRAVWPEREKCISGITFSGKRAAERVQDMSDREVNCLGDRELEKPHGHSHLYLSNSEVQINSGRIPIWQNSKMSFYTMSPRGTAWENHVMREIEIEKVPVDEIEIRRKDLLPIFDHFHTIRSDWADRARSPNFSSNSDGLKAKYLEGAVISSYSKMESSGLTEKPDDGLSRIYYPPILPSLDDNEEEKRRAVLESPLLKQNSFKKNFVSASSRQSTLGVCSAGDSNITNSISTLTIGPPSTDGTILKQVRSSNSGGVSEGSNIGSNCSDLSINNLDEEPIQDSLEFEPFFQEEYCKAADVNSRNVLTETVKDVDNSSPIEREKSEEDADSNDMLGDVFAFSEEG